MSNQQPESKRCRKCKEEVNEGATKCKHCGTDLRNWFLRHPLITIFLALFVLLPTISSVVNPPSPEKETKTLDQQVAELKKDLATPKELRELGAQGYLRLPGNSDSEQVIILAATQEEYKLVTKALLAKDYIGILEIPGAFGVSNGSKVQLVDSGVGLRRVRILEGVRPVDADKIGMAGWVAAEWVVDK